MSPESLFPTGGEPIRRTFGRSIRQILRAALWLAVIGSLFAWLLARRLVDSSSPLGIGLRSAGLPAEMLPAIGVLAVLLLAGYGAWRSLQHAPVFGITDSGLWVKDTRGVFRLPWEGLSADVTGASLRLSIDDPKAVLRTHRGTDTERDLLAEALRNPLYFPQADLGQPPTEVAEWLRPYLRPCLTSGGVPHPGPEPGERQ